MTLAEFRKRHPRCKVGYPSPMFPLIMASLCAAVLVVILRYLVFLAKSFPDLGLDDYFAVIGGVSLTLGVGAGVYVTGKRLGEVLQWMFKGRSVFAVADDEALIVDEAGEGIVFPLADVIKLEFRMNYLEIQMNANYTRHGALDCTVRQVFNPVGDGPGGSAFFNALAPRVKQLAPNAKVLREDPTLFGP